MSLFDDFDRTDESFAEFTEHAYTYLNRCGRPDAQRIRSLLTGWFADYPEEHRAEFLSRFRSTKQWNHDSAAFELLLHAMMRRLGFHLEVHPDVGSPKDRRPDFGVLTASTLFVLEATLLTGMSQAEKNSEALKNKLYDELNRLVETEGFSLSISIQGTPKQPPSAQKIKKFLHEKLDGLDPVVVAERYFENVDRWRYDLEPGCWIDFHPLPLRPDRDTRDDRKPLGMFTMTCWPNDVPRIVEGVKDKVNWYGDLTLPFVIAVNDYGIPDNEDIDEAMSEIWESDSARKVSAVAYFWKANPHHLAHAWMRWYVNPRASRPLLPPAELPTRNIGELFDLPEDWPGTP